MNLLDSAVTLLLVLLLSPAWVLVIQVIAAATWRSRREVSPGRCARVAVVVPAHNEEHGIAATLGALLPQMGAGDRLLVVADNCADATARVAAQAGAEVIERRDALRRGKGYALDFGVRHLEADPPDVVIIIDADCHPAPGALAWLASDCLTGGQPVQALYLMHNPAGAGLRQRIAEFAWLVKNHVRPLGCLRLGIPCQLMGTGMAFPWALIRNAQLATGELVEDMKLGIDLALVGFPPQFCPQALVTSHFPDTSQAQSTQRTRWEHGHLGMIVAQAPRLYREAMRRRDLRLLGMALDLSVPPLALLSAMVGMALVLGLVLWALAASMWPLGLATMAMALLVTAILLAWLGWGRKILPFGALLSIPFYIVAKLPMYLKFWTHRQKDWVRTERK